MIRIIATRTKDTKGYYRYESRQEGTITTVYLPKDKVPTPVPEAITVAVTWSDAQDANGRAL